MNERLQRLGAEVARIQDEALVDSRHRAAVRARLLRVPVPSAPPASRFGRPALGLVFASVAVALVLAVWPRESEVIRYSAGERSVSSQLDEWIAAPNGQTLPIVFSDGSTVQLSPGSRARVRELSAVGASVELERGEANVHVHHASDTRWSVEAGPYVVHVIGTRFRVQWEPSDEAFALEVFEGAVRLSEPRGTRRVSRSDGEVRAQRRPPVPVEPQPQPETEPIIERSPAPTPAIRAPRAAVETPSSRGVAQTHRTSSDANAVSYRPPSAPLELRLPPKTAELVADEPAASEAPVVAEADPPPTPSEESAPVSEPAWKELTEKSEYEKVLSSLSPKQFEELVWQGDASDLVQLAAAARRTKDARAGYIYTVVRSRFSGTDNAANAAFMLGRMQFHAGAPQAAAVWLETYLRERPDGRFAREAAGRLVEAYVRAEDTARAEAAAQRYLARHPAGPHAALARSVLQ